ncbi:hypothetical protein KZY45_004479 [Vibrio vulnificus]|nr:hypothetical protein [Vibrio vulnificus]
MAFDDLNNFPNDVIEQWIAPYAKEEGWPPQLGADGVPVDRWRYLLSMKPLSWWQQGEWIKCKGHLSIHDLTKGSQDTILKMAHSYLTGITNEYSLSISDMVPRLDRVADYLIEHKNLPCPPILYENNGAYSVSDGNHRLCMYYICYGYFKLPIPKKLELLVDQEIEYWLFKAP